MTMLDSKGSGGGNYDNQDYGQGRPSQPAGKSNYNNPQPASASAGPDYGSSGEADYYDDDIPF